MGWVALEMTTEAGMSINGVEVSGMIRVQQQLDFLIVTVLAVTNSLCENHKSSFAIITKKKTKKKHGKINTEIKEQENK